MFGLYILMQLKVSVNHCCILYIYSISQSIHEQANKITVVYHARIGPVRKFGWDDNGDPHVWESKDIWDFRRVLHNLDVWYVVWPELLLVLDISPPYDSVCCHSCRYVADGIEPTTAIARTILITSPEPTVCS